MLSKLGNLLRHFYQVPWCVPAWGMPEFRATCASVLGGRVVEGDAPARAVEAVKDYLGVAYALPVNRGRTALELGLRALGVGPGDEVVLPSYLCRTALDAVEAAGASPVFADVSEDLNVTPDTVRRALTTGTKCVIVPHLFGKAAPIDAIETILRAVGIPLIDDAAQSLGAKRGGRLVGTYGACGVISCGPGKPLAGAAGGLLVMNERRLYERAIAINLEAEPASLVARRTISFWMWRRFRRWTLPLRMVLDRLVGPEQEVPYRRGSLSNLDAEILLCQLKSLERNARIRRSNIERLLPAIQGIADSPLMNWSPDDVAVKLVLVLPGNGPDAGAVIKRLAQAGVECQGGYLPLHLQGRDPKPSLPRTEALFERVVCIPVERAARPRRVQSALTTFRPASDRPLLASEARGRPVAAGRSQ
ncbi:MAG TPA: DegT/DnrJ/EryC1/StrS family aminotransferase [Isosphaeraceae bacterium]|nr:DegT/DnrJ/EryC1/StrS family aminotransferase [Isosphaeraceae bacterium]